jgi:hypothetical protein
MSNRTEGRAERHYGWAAVRKVAPLALQKGVFLRANNAPPLVRKQLSQLMQVNYRHIKLRTWVGGVVLFKEGLIHACRREPSCMVVSDAVYVELYGARS